MRLISNGNVGIGPVFSKILIGGDNQPQSLLRLNVENNLNAWLQITNQTETGQTANDGTRFGIPLEGFERERRVAALISV
jgi:hypothetical protein